MLKLEVLLRTCSYILGLLGQQVDSGIEDWMPLIEPCVQKPIVHAFGYSTPEQERIALNYLRSAYQIWPGDPDFRTIPFWIRANRARDAKFSVGDTAPMVSVYQLNEDGSFGIPKPLYGSEGKDQKDSRIEIVLAGSIT